jgi:hypothetical protein
MPRGTFEPSVELRMRGSPASLFRPDKNGARLRHRDSALLPEGVEYAHCKYLGIDPILSVADSLLESGYFLFRTAAGARGEGVRFARNGYCRFAAAYLSRQRVNGARCLSRRETLACVRTDRVAGHLYRSSNC